MNQKEISKLLIEIKKLYDHEDYQRGLKNVLNALKKDSKQAELLAWKGLFLQKKKEPEAALEAINSAIRLDMKNPKVWKISGIVQKEQNEYVKSLQCFSQAYMKDSSDTEVVTDLCALHLYMRNYKQFLDLCKENMKINQQPSAIIRYIIALFLSNQLNTAIKVLNIFESKLTPSNAEEEYLFRSELGRFHSYILIKSEKYEECINYLLNQKIISDIITIKENLAICYQKLGKIDELYQVTTELLERYPENGDYFDFFEKSMLIEQYIDKLLIFKDTLKSKYAHVRILELLSINDLRFKDLLIQHIQPLLDKGSPAIFATISAFSSEKIEYSIQLTKDLKVSITSIPIKHIFISQCYYYLEKYDEALNEINLGILHTPTIVELYVTKTNILTKMGKSSEALETSKDLFTLDSADRNSNNIYVRQLLKNGFMKTARLTAEPFSIDQKKKSKLFKSEFNKMHFRCGKCALRGGDINLSLKYYEDVLNHFKEYRKGHFSFLSWGVRRAQSFVEMIEWIDNLIQHKHFSKSFINVLRIKFSKNQINECLDLSIQNIKCNQQSVLAYNCVVFSKLNQPLPALKCFKKLNDYNKFISIHSILKLFEKINEFPTIISELFINEFKPFEIKPLTLLEKISNIRGLIYINNFEESKNQLIQLINDYNFNYKIALDLYYISLIELNDINFSKQILELILKKYPYYEIELKNYEKDE